MTQQYYLVNVLAILPIRKRSFKTPMMCFPLIWMHWYPMSIDHALLEADKSNACVFYNTFAFDHPDYDISSSTPDKEYLKKCTDLQLDDIRISIVVKNCLIFMKCDKGIIVRALIACMMLDFYQTIRQKNGFLTRSL